MKKLTLIFIPAFFILSLKSVIAQWSVFGPPVGAAYGFCFKGTDLYVCTNGGVLKSADTAKSWISPLNVGLPSDFAFAIGSDQTHLFVSLQHKGVFTSANNGDSWSPANSGLPAPSASGYDYASDFETVGNLVFAAFPTGGVYKSSNFGASWTLSDNGLPEASALKLAQSKNCLFVVSSNAVYKSTDNGNNWIPAANGLPMDVVYDLFVDSTTVYAACGFGGVYKTADLGLTWIACGFAGLDIRTVMAKNEVIVAADYDDGTLFGQLYLSKDSGATHTAVPWFTPQTRFNELGIAAKTIIIADSWGIESYDYWAGGIVKQATEGFSSDIVNGIIKHNNKLYEASEQFSILSNDLDGSLNWNQSGAGFTTSPVKCLATNGAKIYAGLGNSGGIYYSNNNGSTWIADIYGFAPGAFFIDGTSIYAGTLSSAKPVLKGTIQAAGSGFVNSSNGIAPETDVFGFAKSVSRIYAVTSAGVYATDDEGDNWSLVVSGLPSILYTSIIIDGSMIYLGSGGQGIFVSANNGASFTASNNGLQNLTVKALIKHDNKIYAGTEMGIYESADSGVVWIPSCLSTGAVLSFLSDGPTLYAGTSGRGIWEADNTPWTALADKEKVNMKIFPNPASSVFSVESSQAIDQIQIFNASGTMVFSSRNAGLHADIPITQYANGIYFIRIHLKDKIMTQKLVVRH